MSMLPSTEQRRARLRLVLLLVFGVGTTVMLLLFANRDSISLYYTPSKIAAGKAPTTRAFRVGGMVEAGSVKRQKDGVTVRFTVTDYAHKTVIQYKGVLPDMFAEKQAAVAKGRINKEGIFVATEVLAKHDEKYLPPAVRKSLKNKKPYKADKK